MNDKLNKFNKKDLFYCYSINLFHFLKANGFFYVVRGVNPNNDLSYWVFERTPNFLEALTQWNEVKKK
ncbi:DUF5659 domain-containing protein [Aquibacillus saliphilus]|uniref:DUF5659 domain-containing protein n=1 Tax=Aquibacillus saliphilus TaxID=1909422 RepID=UPI001CF017C7|nr:DUF5659 domain-containing protein [Aquibacillus saliphilus]